jgi:nitrogen fixation protein FixH
MNNPHVQVTEKGISQSSKRALRNPWVLGWLALVLTVLGVNSFFIAAAVITSPGLVEEDYYEKGRDHEKNLLKRREAHQSLGWQYGLQFPEQININTDIPLSFNAVDEAGLPLRDAVVSISAYRPSDADADFGSTMKETVPGMYETRMQFSLKGIWDLIIKVQQAEQTLELRRRISVQG